MRTQLIILLLTLESVAFGQQPVLDSLNWNTGDYKFYFVDKSISTEEVEDIKLSEWNESKITFEFQIDSLNSFLIADQEEIQSLRYNWSGVPTEEILLCGYDYFIYVIQDNSIEHELRVNLECGQVVTDFGVFNFKGNPFKKLKNTIPIWVMSSKHKTLESGREFISNLNSNIMLAEKDEWINFDGHFSVDRNIQDGSIKEFEQLIQKTYPTADFDFKLSGAGPRSFTYTLYSDSIFYQNFRLDKKGKWNKAEANWITYFSEDTELLKRLLE